MQIAMNLHQKFIYVLLALFIWFSPIMVYAQSSNQVSKHDPTNVPKIVFEGSKHDFGTVQPNTPLTHNFVFENKGTAPLLIEKIKAGWGCTAALASASEIPPGGEGKIKVTFKPSKRTGIQSKSITVETNDPESRKLSLKVSAIVKVVLAVDPTTLVFQPFIGSQGSSEPQYARLTGSESASVNITSIKSDNKLLNVEIDKDGFDGEPARQIRFTMMPGMSVGRFREAVVLKTDNKNVEALKLYVVGEVLGNITVSPRHLPLGMIGPESMPSKTIVLKATRDTYGFNIIDVSSTVKDLSTKLVTVTEGKEYQVVVSLPEGTSYPIIRGEIIIKTDDKEQENITIRVFGRTAPPARRNRPEERNTGVELPPM